MTAGFPQGFVHHDDGRPFPFAVAAATVTVESMNRALWHLILFSLAALAKQAKDGGDSRKGRPSSAKSSGKQVADQSTLSSRLSAKEERRKNMPSGKMEDIYKEANTVGGCMGACIQQCGGACPDGRTGDACKRACGDACKQKCEVAQVCVCVSE